MLYREYMPVILTQVLAVTFDGSAVNRRLLKLHSQSDNDLIYKLPNPFTADNRDIFFFSDPPHLIKTARNCLASNHRELWVILYINYYVNKEHPL